MKSVRFLISLIALVVLIACQEQTPVESPLTSEGGKDGAADIQCHNRYRNRHHHRRHNNNDYYDSVAHFQVSLVDGYPKQVGDNYVWVWKIRNPHPSCRTNKDMSHWAMSLGDCATLENVVYAAYSCNGIFWHFFTPSYQVDPSTSDCNSIGSTLKFDYGTNDNRYSYYMLVVNQEFQVDDEAQMVVKYGRTCEIGSFEGIGCPPEQQQEEPCYGNDGYAWAGDENFYSTSYYYIKFFYNTTPDVTYDLHDSLGTVVGNVHVYRENTTVNVEFTTTGTWYLKNTYMHYSQIVSTIPKSGAYIRPNEFTYQATHDPYVQTYSYSFEQSDCAYIYIAVYADIIQQVECE